MGTNLVLIEAQNWNFVFWVLTDDSTRAELSVWAAGGDYDENLGDPNDVRCADSQRATDGAAERPRRRMPDRRRCAGVRTGRTRCGVRAPTSCRCPVDLRPCLVRCPSCGPCSSRSLAALPVWRSHWMDFSLTRRPSSSTHTDAWHSRDCNSNPVVRNSHENHLLEQRMHMHIRQLGYSIFLEKQK
jgi:hypothetical protein